MIVAVGTIALAAVCLAVLGTLVGRRVYRSHPTELVMFAWTLAIFAPALGSVFGRSSQLGSLIKQIDEPFTMLLFAVTLLERRRPTARWLVIVPALGFLCAGLASNILQGTSPLPAIVGGWSGIKIWVLLYITISLPWHKRDFEMVSRWITVIVLAVLSIAVVELIAPSFLHSIIPVQSSSAELRFGRAGLQSVFTHPDHFGSFGGLFGAWYLARFVCTGNRRHLALGIACISLGLLSLRLKVILSIVAALSVIGMSATRLFVRRLGVAVLVAVCFVAASGGMLVNLTTQQLDRYLFSDNVTIRQELYDTGRSIAVEHFPFGVGLGQFGSGASTTFNSPIYEEYGLNRGGLTEEDPGTRHDTTWPTVVGETGVLGMFFFFAGLIYIGFRLRQYSRAPDGRRNEMALAALAVLTSIMIESVARPSFFNSVTALSLAIIVAGPLELGSRRRALQSPLNRSINQPLTAAGPQAGPVGAINARTNERPI